MEQPNLLSAARVIVARHRTPAVCRATVEWFPDEAKLFLRYYTFGLPTKDDAEACEDAMGELLAGFPDINVCETLCTQVSALMHSTRGQVVFEARA